LTPPNFKVADIVTPKKFTTAHKDDGPYIMVMQICNDHNYFHTYFLMRLNDASKYYEDIEYLDAYYIKVA
jgi:hypothetical protein